MQEIKCPNCGEVIQVDESDYMQIVQQVRDKEFDKELARREQMLQEQQEANAEVLRMKQEQAHQNDLIQKDQQLLKKDQELAELRAKLDSSETAKSWQSRRRSTTQREKCPRRTPKLSSFRGNYKIRYLPRSCRKTI